MLKGVGLSVLVSGLRNTNERAFLQQGGFLATGM